MLGPFLFNLYVNDLVNAAAKCSVVQYADDTTIVVKSKRNGVTLQNKAEKVIASILKWFVVNRLDINVNKTKFIAFGKAGGEIASLSVENQIILKLDVVNFLGLRIDADLQWTTHINYVISRMKQTRTMLARIPFLFDTNTRIYLAKTLVLLIINMYDFIYGSSATRTLRYLDTAYNDLMRSILGFRRSQHVRIIDMYNMISFDPLAERRNKSLLKFMKNVESGQLYSSISMLFVKPTHRYATRVHDYYVIPNCKTNLGKRRVSVRGLALLNLEIGK